MVAAATIAVAFGGYVGELIDVPEWILILALVVVLGTVASIGVQESVTSAGVITVIELAGLLLVVIAARGAWTDAPARADELIGLSGGAWTGVFSGAFLAFFAFHGFEDMDSVAEETIDARRTMPLAIVLTLVVTTVIYVIVAATAVLAVPPAELADSDAPLALIFETAGGRPEIMAAIAGIAMVNGVLVQMVMAPRVVYGLTQLGLLPRWAGAVSARTGTPVRATIASVIVIAVLALTFDLEGLARVTSGVVMAVFVSINVCLIVIKRREGPTTTFQVPAWLPWLGAIASIAMFVIEVAVGVE